MLNIAVTGGIACGKSLVTSRLLESFPDGRASRFDCDESVRKLLQEPGVAKRVAELDPAVVFDSDSGTLDKVSLRKLTFEKSQFRERLEALLHPLVLEQVRRHIAEIGEKVRIALIEVPLLYEVSFPLKRDIDLVVAASSSTQIARLSGNRQIQPDLAGKIIEAQMPLQEKINRGDIVLWNDGDITSLEAQIMHLANRCAALFKK